MRAIPPTLKVSLSFGCSRAHDHADPPHPLGLLRARRERPRGCTAQQRNERAPFHSLMPPVLTSERIAQPSFGDPAYDRYGS
jgi:hypothetical protein